MKKIIALVVALFLVGTILVPMARINAENVTAVKIYIDKSTAYVNGKATTLDQPPVIMNNRTMVPIRFVTEAMGATVDWSNEERKVTITLGENIAILKIDDAKAQANGYDVYLDSAPTIIVKTSRTVVPVRFVAETLGMEVTWNGTERSVLIKHSPDWQPVEVSFWHAMNYTQGEVLDSLIEEYNATHPRTEIQGTVFSSYNPLQQKTIAAIAGGNPPVLTQAYENWVAEYITGGYLTPMEKFVNGANGILKSDREDFFENMWANGYLPDGKMWMLPFNKSNIVMYYNVDMLEENGIAVPKTWDQFEEACKLLTKEDNSQWGCSYTPSVDLWYARVYEYGGEVLSKDNRKVLLDKTSAALNATTAMNDMIQNGYIHVTSGYNYQTDYGNQKCAFTFASVASYYYMNKAVGGRFQFAEAPLPAGPAGQHSVMYGTNVVIFGSTSSQAQQDGAWDFVKWFTSPRKTAQWAMGTGYLPVRKSALELPEMKEFLANHPEVHAGYDQLANCVMQPPISAWNNSRRDVNATLEKIYLGKISPEGGLKELTVKLKANIGEK
ncbi:MAG: extracellular solute-binding protein [Caldisericaceae bacterium]|nr:extracellular solute-binding protein [Caldisericaceae bacterium]